MRKTLVSILAVSAVFALAAGPASAKSHHGFGFSALVAGIAGAVIGAEIVAHSDHERECFTRHQNIYDDYGNYLGRREIETCR